MASNQAGHKLSIDNSSLVTHPDFANYRTVVRASLEETALFWAISSEFLDFKLLGEP